MENIKWFKEMLMPNPFNISSPYVDGYFIKFDDGSELEMHFEISCFSIKDCVKGKQRNSFKINNTFDSALNKLETLKNKFGKTMSNEGEIILVNNKNIQKKVQL